MNGGSEAGVSGSKSLREMMDDTVNARYPEHIPPICPHCGAVKEPSPEHLRIVPGDNIREVEQ